MLVTRQNKGASIMSNYLHIPVKVIIKNYFRGSEFAFAMKQGERFYCDYCQITKISWPQISYNINVCSLCKTQ
jgi:hypothetical protein